MRIAAVAMLLVACHPKPVAQREDASPIASVVALVDAAPPAEPEKPLTWGTRPPATGPLFPVIDGSRLVVFGSSEEKGAPSYAYPLQYKGWLIT